jgi:hypothetical protein
VWDAAWISGQEYNVGGVQTDLFLQTLDRRLGVASSNEVYAMVTVYALWLSRSPTETFEARMRFWDDVMHVSIPTATGTWQVAAEPGLQNAWRAMKVAVDAAEPGPKRQAISVIGMDIAGCFIELNWHQQEAGVMPNLAKAARLLAFVSRHWKLFRAETERSDLYQFGGEKLLEFSARHGKVWLRYIVDEPLPKPDKSATFSVKQAWKSLRFTRVELCLLLAGQNRLKRLSGEGVMDDLAKLLKTASAPKAAYVMALMADALIVERARSSDYELPERPAPWTILWSFRRAGGVGALDDLLENDEKRPPDEDRLSPEAVMMLKQVQKWVRNTKGTLIEEETTAIVDDAFRDDGDGEDDTILYDGDEDRRWMWPAGLN